MGLDQLATSVRLEQIRQGGPDQLIRSQPELLELRPERGRHHQSSVRGPEQGRYLVYEDPQRVEPLTGPNGHVAGIAHAHHDAPKLPLLHGAPLSHSAVTVCVGTPDAIRVAADILAPTRGTPRRLTAKR